jgi:hypothetical protein
MGTWKDWSGLAFCEYKDWKLLEGIHPIPTRRNAIFYSRFLSRLHGPISTVRYILCEYSSPILFVFQACTDKGYYL